MSKNLKLLTSSILSMSLLTVMAGAAVAPALGAVHEHFTNASPILVQLIVSLPALFIILTNFTFPYLCRLMHTKTLALVGLVLYVVTGCGAFFSNNIVILLVLRALLGVSVGMIMPLSTGLLAFYFSPEKIAGLMGLSAAMNQMGGVVATLLAGLLCNIAWNYAFLVYAIGLIAIIMVVIILPNEQLSRNGNEMSIWQLLRRFHPSVGGMLLLMLIFFIFPTNFAITTQTMGISQNVITFIMVGLDVVAFFVGLVFGHMMKECRKTMKYFAPSLFLIGMLFYSFASGLWLLIIGSVVIGIANGIGVPYINTIASIKGGKESATTVMPLLSAALYLGQFCSPLIVTPIASAFFGADDIYGVYKVGVGIAVLFLIQTICTRKFHKLPPVA